MANTNKEEIKKLRVDVDNIYKDITKMNTVYKDTMLNILNVQKIMYGELERNTHSDGLTSKFTTSLHLWQLDHDCRQHKDQHACFRYNDELKWMKKHDIEE